MSLVQKIKGFLSKAVFFVFFLANTAFLTAPIVWTNIFSLAYLNKVLKSPLVKGFNTLSVVLLFYLLAHLFFSSVEDWQSYIQSTLYLFFIYFNLLAAILFIERHQKRFPNWFQQLSLLSFLVFLGSFILLGFGKVTGSWQLHEFLMGGRSTYRYFGFVYEPSYYAFLMSPLLIYFLLSFLVKRRKVSLLYFLLILLPVAATFSMGLFSVLLSSFILAILLVLMIHKFLPKFLWLPIGVSLLVVLMTMSTDNIVKERVVGIFKGKDTSVKGRTLEAYYLGFKMAEEKNSLVGIGPGQIKTVGERHIRTYYCYPKEEWPDLAIPNTMAETLAIYGILGFLMRLGLLLFLFMKFNVYKNYFNLTLFCFLFLYQFAGSFITSTAEYCLWVMALFVNFEEMNIPKGNRVVSA